MFRSLLCALALASCVAFATAQQLEVNDATGTLTSLGQNPTPGAPFVVNVNGVMFLEVRGLQNQPFVLVGGQLATTSTQIPAAANQWFDLDLATAFVVGDGINGSAGFLPAAFFATNANGVASFVFPATTALLGQTLAFQGFVSDPTQPVVPLNLTAAGSYVFSAAQSFNGTGHASYTFPSGAYSIYGQAFTNLTASSHGWVRLGGGAVSADPGRDAVRFVNGTVGAGVTAVSAPILAPAWMEIQGSGSTVTIEETAPGRTEIVWSGGSVLDVSGPTLVPYGSFSCAIDTTGPTPQIVFDYTNATIMSFGSPPQSSGHPIVGISDGGTASANVVVHDLVSGGMVVPTPLVAQPTAIHQDMLSPIEVFDLNGHVLTFTDQTGTGAFVLM